LAVLLVALTSAKRRSQLLGTGRRLLLADDSITIQKVVNLTFADEGFEVVTVGNGDLAVEKIEDLTPDIVLADIHMPGLNGYEVCEFVKRNERFRHIPVMLLVGSFEPFNEAEARRVGADDYLTKPFQSIRQLVSKVGALLGGKSAADDEESTKDLVRPAEAVVQHETPSEPHPWEALGETVQETPARAEAPGMADRGDSFTDPSLDDGMIEATPAGEFSLNRTSTSHQRPTTPLTASDLEEAGINLNQRIPGLGLNPTSSVNMQDSSIVSEAALQSEQLHQPQFAAGARPVEPAIADDTLLDLGEMEAASPRTNSDDFVLDIWDDAPAPAPSERSEAFEPVAPSMTAATPLPTQDLDDLPGMAGYESAAAEPMFAEPIVEAAPVEEPHTFEASPEPQTFEASPEPEMFEASPEPPAFEASPEPMLPVLVEPQLETDSAEPAVESAALPPVQSGQVALDQLSPETIDAIAKRVVEMMSTKVVEEIAWEVVPQLSELMIKRRLEEEQKR
jgi:CheY-like chemotaxis protein